jgi:hypothetical protein
MARDPKYNEDSEVSNIVRETFEERLRRGATFDEASGDAFHMLARLGIEGDRRVLLVDQSDASILIQSQQAEIEALKQRAGITDDSD